MAERLRAAVIGLGVGELHAAGYTATPTTDLVALSDLNPTRLDAAGAKYGVERLYTDYRELLDAPDIDVVSVALPNMLHASVSLDALDAGKHVLCEKPLALNAAEAQTIVDRARAVNRQLMVCFNYRFRGDARWLKAAINENRMGTVYAAKAGWLRNSGIPGRNTWFTRKAASGGGPLIDLGVHMLDMTLWLLDYPAIAAVSGATFARFGPRGQKSWLRFGDHPGPITYDVEDMAMAMIRFADGRVMTLETTWASQTRSGRDDYFVTLYGDEGGADLYVANYTDRDTVTFYTEMFNEPVDIRPTIGQRPTGHTATITHFADAILNGVPIEAPGEHGVVLMQLIDAIYQSAAEGREIRLDG